MISRVFPVLPVLFALCSYCNTLNGPVHPFRADYGPGAKRAADNDTNSPDSLLLLYGPWHGSTERQSSQSAQDLQSIRPGDTYTIYFDNGFFKYMPDLFNENEILVVFTFDEGGSGEDSGLVKIIGPMNRAPDQSMASQIAKISFGPKKFEGDSLKIKVQVVEFDADERENRGAFLEFVGQAAESFNLADPVTAGEIKLAKEIAKTVNDLDQNDEVLTFEFELVPPDDGASGQNSDYGLPMRAGFYGLIKEERTRVLTEYGEFTRNVYASTRSGWWLATLPLTFVSDILVSPVVMIRNAYFDLPDEVSTNPLRVHARPLEDNGQRDAVKRIADNNTDNTKQDAETIRTIPTKYLRERLDDDAITEGECGKKSFQWFREDPKAPTPGHRVICEELERRRNPAGYFDSYFGLMGDLWTSDRWPLAKVFGTFFFALPVDMIASPGVAVKQIAAPYETYQPRGAVLAQVDTDNAYLEDVNPAANFLGGFAPIAYDTERRTLRMGDQIYSNKTWLTFSVEKGRDDRLWRWRKLTSKAEQRILDLLRTKSTAEILEGSKVREAIEELNQLKQEVGDPAARVSAVNSQGLYEIPASGVALRVPVRHAAGVCITGAWLYSPTTGAQSTRVKPSGNCDSSSQAITTDLEFTDAFALRPGRYELHIETNRKPNANLPPVTSGGSILKIELRRPEPALEPNAPVPPASDTTKPQTVSLRVAEFGAGIREVCVKQGDACTAATALAGGFEFTLSNPLPAQGLAVQVKLSLAKGGERWQEVYLYPTSGSPAEPSPPNSGIRVSNTSVKNEDKQFQFFAEIPPGDHALFVKKGTTDLARELKITTTRVRPGLYLCVVRAADPGKNLPDFDTLEFRAERNTYTLALSPRQS